MPQVTSEFLAPYIQNHKLRHPLYEETVELAESINLHASGEFPKKLIGERRPAESPEIHAYREKIYVPKTKPTFTKIYNSLQKIPRSPDFSIMFDEDLPAKIPKDESLKQYISEGIPRWGSIDAWYWGICFRTYLIDANAVVLTIPLNVNSENNEYYKPIPIIFTSDRIIDYKEGVYYILESSDKVRYVANGITYEDGRKYYVVQSDVVQAFHYLKMKDTIEEVMNIVNVTGYIPVRTLRGICTEQGEGYALYESRIAGIVPMLNEAVREYSDMQAEIVMHIHSTMWTIQPQSCKDCKGSGRRVLKENTAPVICESCKGTGNAPMNPYEHLTIPMPKAGELQAPTPPMGYVQKDTAIATLQESRIRQHITDALASINMEYLAEVPLSQSGVAKQVDREELYSFVHSVAIDSVRIESEIIYDINAWRYKESITDLETLESMLPEITIPERFDLLSAGVLIEELKGMIEAKVDPAIINATQIDLTEKRFANDPTVRDTVKLKLKLDPFAGVSEEAISLYKTFGVVSELDMVISANISEFVNRAMMEHKNFGEMQIKEQQGIIKAYAMEKMKEIDPIERPDETIDETRVEV